MTTNTFATLKSYLVMKPFTGALIIYQHDDIIQDQDFLDFIDNTMIQANVEYRGARMLITEKEQNFPLNHSFFKDIYEHTPDNRLVIFKGSEIFVNTSLEDLKKSFFSP